MSKYATDYRDAVKQLGLLAERSELDLQISRNHLIMTGYSIYSDSMNAYLSKLQGLEPQQMTLLQVIPYNAMYMSYIAVDNYADYYKNSIEFFNSKLMDELNSPNFGNGGISRVKG